jgi:hypothetical protein
MKKVTDENIIPLFAEEAKKQDEAWKKSIPAQVFLNYFFSINYHLHHSDEGGLQRLTFFREHFADLDKKDLEAIGKLLMTSWSTEYALRATAELGSDEYLRHALHWTFPQAYYTIFAGLQAFLYTLNIKTSNAEIARREVGRLVVRNAYPRAIGYYAAGPYPDFSIHRLPLAGYKASLQIPAKEIEAQAQIGQFLRTTRKMQALHIRRQVQTNSQTALRSPKTGKILDKWNAAHWQQITWRIGYTTLFDLLSRLRISTTNKEIDRFVEAEIDFKLFHESLLEIVSYLNGIHESYVAKAMGLEKYQHVVASLPAHLQQGFVAARLRDKIEPLFHSDQDQQLKMAA